MSTDAKDNRKNYSWVGFFLNRIRSWNPFHFIFDKSRLGKRRFGKPALSSGEEFDNIVEPKLEGIDGNTSTIILSSDLSICGRNDKILGSRETTKTSKRTNDKGESAQKGAIILPTKLLPPNKHIYTGYKVPRSGRVGLWIESEEPVTSYILDEEGLKDFYAGEPEIDSKGGFTNKRSHHQEIYLDFKGTFYLVIMNERDRPTKIHWEIY